MTFYRMIQEHAAEAAGAHGEATSEGIGSIAEIPTFISHHLEDAREFHFAGMRFDLRPLAFDPIHIGPVTLDLSPTRQLFFIFLAALLCIAIFVPVAKALVHKDSTRAPRGFSNAMEALVLYFRDNVVRSNIGHGADGYTPFILTIFFFILFMNLLGLTPLGVTPTGNLSVTAAMALIAFVTVEVSGMISLGFKGYAQTIFFMPHGLPTVMKPVMLVIMAPVEFLGKLTKPFALAVRLFANMMAGHILILALVGLILVTQSYLVGVGSVLIMSALMILELFVAFLQAYIFSMLTSVFIGLIRHAH
ncbi:MAG: F0F1 ATP synthase subunit A [Gemmatimonadetes bacterium]|nr:F0F1 ATP synthase subunit A [Gemmatimonadota bacterium]